ncbi:MAG: ATP-binding protein [Bacteroidota bacterium]
MNFIIDADGKVVDLKENILDLLPPDLKVGNSLLKIQQIINGLPEIFPLLNSKDFKTYKNLVLKKDIGSFGTNPGQHYYNLSIQALNSLQTPLFICRLEKFISETDAVLAANQKCFNLYLRYLKGSLFEIDAQSKITKILSDGPRGVLKKFGIETGLTILELLDFNLAKKFKSKVNEVLSTKSDTSISHRFRTRNWELFIDCKLSYKEDDCLVVYVLDDTENIKNFEEKEAFARFPLENTNPVVRVNTIGKVLFTNKSGDDFCQKIGLKNNIITNKDVRAIIKACLFDSKRRDLKLKVNKQYFFLNFSPNLEHNYLNIYGTNITQQERIAEKLQQKTTDLNSILNSSDDVILLINKNLELVYFNNQSLKVLNDFGIKKIETWQNIFQFMPESVKELFEQNSALALKKNSIIRKEFSHNDIKNNQRYFSATFYPAIDKPNNRSIGICIQLKEITATEKAKKEIFELKNFYEKILNNLPTDIAVLDKDYKYLFINPQAISNEATREWLVGKDDYDYARLKNINADFADRRKHIFTDVASSGIAKSFEDLHLQKDGKQVYILRKYYPVYNEKKELEMMLGYGLDITSIKESELAAKRSEEQLRLANSKLQKNYSQLMQYSYVVSHNLRAPIANLVGLSNFFDDTGHDKNNTIIKHIKDSSERIDEILKDLNSILAIREEINKSVEQVSLMKVLNEVKSDLKFEIDDANAIITTNFNECDMVHSINSFMHSIFYNLISNSLKYRDRNRDCLINISADFEDKSVTLKFGDNGIGIDMNKYRDKVFGLYRRFHKDVAEGTGVGLHLIKEQIETLGGSIHVESELGKGTTFTIELNELDNVETVTN